MDLLKKTNFMNKKKTVNWIETKQNTHKSTEIKKIIKQQIFSDFFYFSYIPIYWKNILFVSDLHHHHIEEIAMSDGQTVRAKVIQTDDEIYQVE